MVGPAMASKNEEDITSAKALSKALVQENIEYAHTLKAKDITFFCVACEPYYSILEQETDLKIQSVSDLFDQYYPGGSLIREIDFSPGCYRFRRRITQAPIEFEAATRLLNKVKGLHINPMDSTLCCFKPENLQQLIDGIKTKTLVTICNGCAEKFSEALKDRGDIQVKMLHEILLEALDNNS